MAYFPNGDAFEAFEGLECRDCIHNTPDEDAEGCPVIKVHFFFNYDQLDAGEEALRAALDMLVDDDLPYGEKCMMRAPTPATGE